MASYSAYLGRRVEVQYRAGDIFLPATGTLAADSGKSIFLEEHSVQQGKEKHFRWEIPYCCIMKVEEKPLAPKPVRNNAELEKAAQRTSADTDASVAGDSGPMLPLRNHIKEA